jgi:copper(I)-binding protein
MRRWLGLGAALLGLWLLGACATPAQLGAVPRGDAVRVEGAWLRPAVGGTSALYLQIVNPTATPDQLLAVETGVAASAEFHQTTNDNGILRMRPQPAGVQIPAQQVVAFAPGGTHVMLVGVDSELVVGQRVPVVLVFAQAGRLEIPVPVQDEPPG